MTGTTLAETLAEARRAGGPLVLPTPADLAAGYAVQDAYAAAVAARAGGVAGFKLAINGKPQMAHFGVTEPACARLFGAEVWTSGATVPAAGLAVEAELCAVLGQGLRAGAPFDRARTIAAIDRFHAAFELVDMRGRVLPQTPLTEAVALNVFNAGVVLGEASAPATLDPAGIEVALSIDGAEVARAKGAAPQDPVEAVQWLLNHLAGRGVPVLPGMIVMCGTHVPLTPVPPGAGRLAFTMTGLGEVAFSVR